MKLLLVLAHPLEDSFTFAVAQAARDALEANGHEVDWLDLYREDFEPRLSAEERRAYLAAPYDASAISPLAARLLAADGLILVFPTWWFGLPAILKGYLDRVFAPGVAFDHRPGGGLVGRLANIKLLYALTSTGSPSWVVRLALGDPVRRILRRGIATLCAKQVTFRMLCLHDMDRASAAKRQAHLQRVRKAIARI